MLYHSIYMISLFLYYLSLLQLSNLIMMFPWFTFLSVSCIYNLCLFRLTDLQFPKIWNVRLLFCHTFFIFPLLLFFRFSDYIYIKFFKSLHSSMFCFLHFLSSVFQFIYFLRPCFMFHYYFLLRSALKSIQQTYFLSQMLQVSYSAVQFESFWFEQ